MTADLQREGGSNDDDGGCLHDPHNHRVTDDDRGREDRDAHGFERNFHD